jgi:hypothetical protein
MTEAEYGARHPYTPENVETGSPADMPYPGPVIPVSGTPCPRHPREAAGRCPFCDC